MKETDQTPLLLYSTEEIENIEKIPSIDIVIVAVFVRKGWGGSKYYWRVLPHEFKSVEEAKIWVKSLNINNNWAKIKFYKLS